MGALSETEGVIDPEIAGAGDLDPEPEQTRDQDGDWSLEPVLTFILIVVGLISFCVALTHWFPSFLSGFTGWLGDPSTSLHPTFGITLATVRVVLGIAAYGFLSWTEVRLLARRITLCRDHSVTAGLTVLLAACQLGLVVTWELVFGVVGPWPIVVVGLIGVAGSLAAWHRGAPRSLVSSEGQNDTSGDSKLWGKGLFAAAAVIVGLCALHAGSQPITEFDSLIYHAQLSKYWFEHAPSPPLQYGPSIGSEISANYPPLWAAIGTGLYEFAGRFNDLYVRLISPALFCGLLSFTYGATRCIFGKVAARWSVLLLLGTPLLLFYAMWPTNYLLLTFLFAAAIVFTYAASQSPSTISWAFAGALCGFAALTNFYGWVAAAVGLLAVILSSGGRRWVRASVFVAVCLAIPIGWLIRNEILLGDPVYPLLTSVLHDKGVLPQIWSITQTEVRQTASATWMSTGSLLRVRELASALWSSILLPTGMLPGIVVFAYMVRRSRAALLFLVAVLGWLFATLAPGWYFLRALLPVVPLLAIGAAVILSGRGDTADVLNGAPEVGAPAVPRQSSLPWAALSVAVALVTLVTGLAVAVSAPSQMSGTPQLSSADWRSDISALGSTDATLYSATGGDSLAWQWLNSHADPTHVIATLEVRTYYLDPALPLLYLDGRTVVPLLRAKSPAQVAAFLEAHSVDYILVPGWAIGSPVLSITGVDRVLGTPSAPLVASFAPYQGLPLTNIYRLGGHSSAFTAAVNLQPGSPAPTLAEYRVPSGSHGSILLGDDGLSGQGTRLIIRYRAQGAGTFSVSAGARTFISRRFRGATGWRTVDVPLPSSFSALSLRAIGAEVDLRPPTVTSG